MKELLDKLYAARTLDYDEALRLLRAIASEELNHAQIASILTVFIMRPIYADELKGFQDGLLEMAIPFDLRGRDAVDVCGTGGDGKNSFNISTLAAFVVAGAGYKVVKHGNYSVSSLCGSSNVLEYLGHTFTNNEDTLQAQLDNAGICFLHAPLFHPAMKAVAPVRKALATRTFFNMLGPLVNPANPGNQLTGVFSLELARTYKGIQDKNNRNYTIIHSLDGYDEISLTSGFKVYTNADESTLSPESIGQQRISGDDITGGENIAASAKIFKDVINNTCTDAQRSVVLTNAAFAIRCFDFSKPIEDCISEARESLVSGRARTAFESLLNSN